MAALPRHDVIPRDRDVYEEADTRTFPVNVNAVAANVD
jgi:hypothetical protein